MNRPPARLDGANVLQWVTSRTGCFYVMPGSKPPVCVAAMAICRYEDSGSLYLFKCNPVWEVVQDWDCETVEEAVESANQFAGDEVLEWETAR